MKRTLLTTKGHLRPYLSAAIPKDISCVRCRDRATLTEDDTAYGTEHEHQCDSPSDLSILLVELLREFRDRKRHREEVEGIP